MDQLQREINQMFSKLHPLEKALLRATGDLSNLNQSKKVRFLNKKGVLLCTYKNTNEMFELMGNAYMPYNITCKETDFSYDFMEEQ